MVVVVTGVSGSGKTTVGRALASSLRWAFLDADALHTAENLEKMRTGRPLDDADRGPWLERLRDTVRRSLETRIDLVLACSALTRAYRERLVVDPAAVKLVRLVAPRDVLAARIAQREGHFFPVELLDTQLGTLDEAGAGVIEVDSTRPLDGVVTEIAARVL